MDKVTQINQMLESMIGEQLPKWRELKKQKEQLYKLQKSFEDATQFLRDEINKNEDHFERLRLSSIQLIHAGAEDTGEKSYMDKMLSVQLRNRLEIESDEALLKWAEDYEDAFVVDKKKMNLVVEHLFNTNEKFANEVLQVDLKQAKALAKSLVGEDEDTPAKMVEYYTDISKDSFAKTLSTLLMGFENAEKHQED